MSHLVLCLRYFVLSCFGFNEDNKTRLVLEGRLGHPEHGRIFSKVVLHSGRTRAPTRGVGIPQLLRQFISRVTLKRHLVIALRPLGSLGAVRTLPVAPPLALNTSPEASDTPPPPGTHVTS